MSESENRRCRRRGGPSRTHAARHFRFEDERGRPRRDVRLNRPERKNPLTFDSYAELRDLFRDLVYASDVRAVVLTGAGGNFCSGGDVFEIIEPLTRMKMPDLLAFTRMTGDLVKAMRKAARSRSSPRSTASAPAPARFSRWPSDLRLATPEAKTAFLFTRVGLAGADMGACGILPRIIGQGRAAELLLHRPRDERRGGRRLGLLQRACTQPPTLEREAQALARSLADGPWFAHGMTKTMLNQEWAMGIDEMIESEAQAQAICMATGDFRRAFEAFAAKRKPVFEGN